MTNYSHWFHGVCILVEGDRRHNADMAIDKVIWAGGKTFGRWSQDDLMGKS